MVAGIDADSSDSSYDLLAGALGEERVLRLSPARGGFGGAVKAALASLAPASRDGDASGDWIWLLHDDAAPDPEALAELLHAVERAPSVTIAGCKQLDWDEPRRLIDVGLSVSRWAERVTLIDLDELDQGQYDGRSDMFAVNSAGMLVRRDVWEALKGFDPAVPGVGDDVDLCWRNRLAGNRVVVVPGARMFHAARRPRALGNAAAARQAQVHLRLKHAPVWQVPFLALGALLGSLLRFVLTVLAKDPGYGATQLVATVAALLRPAALWRSRRSAARTRTVSRSVPRALRTSRRDVWAHRRSLLESLAPDDVVGDGSGSDSRGFEPSGDSTDDFAALATAERGWAGTGALISALLLLAASLISFSRLFGAEAATGGALLPVSDSLGEIWHNASAWWISLGPGFAGHGDPFDYVIWLLGVLGFGDASLAVIWTLLLALPLAGLGAWFVAASLTRRRWPRFVAALAWAAAPSLQVALAQGRLGAVLAHLLIPAVVLGMIRALGLAKGAAGAQAAEPAEHRGADRPAKPGTNGVPSWTAAAAAGLALAALAACSPLLFPVAVLAVLAVTALMPRRAKTLWWSLLPGAALLLPFVLSALQTPRALLADPGVPLPFDPAPLWEQLLGQPVRFDAAAGITGLGALPSGGAWALAAALVLGGPLVLAAAVALFVPGRRAWLARGFWLVALLALAAGWLAGRVPAAQTGNTLVAPFPGPAVSLACFALLAAAVAGADELLRRLAGRRGGRAAQPAVRAAVVVVAAVLALVPALGTALYTARNLTDPGTPAAALQPDGSAQAARGAAGLGTARLVGPGPQRTLPATATDRGTGPEQSRSLVLSVDDDGAVTSALMRGAGTTLDRLSAIAAARGITGAPGAEKVAPDDAATTDLRSAVATVVAATGVDPRASLERLGAGFVVLQHSNTAAELLAGRIDSVPGLDSIGQTDAGWLWRVTPPAADGVKAPDAVYRARLVDSQGRTLAGINSELTDIDTTVPRGPEGRQLVLAERSDRGWAAYLNGRKLTSTTSGWAQSFTVPASGGHLEVRHDSDWAPWLAALQIIVLGLTVLLAVPLRARRRRSGISRDEGALRREGAHV